MFQIKYDILSNSEHIHYVLVLEVQELDFEFQNGFQLDSVKSGLSFNILTVCVP